MARSGTTVTFQALQGHPNVRALMDEVRVSPFFTRGLEVFTTGGANDYEKDHGMGLLVDALTLIPCSIASPQLMGYGGLPESPKSPSVLANGLKTALSGSADAVQFVEAMTKRASLQDFAVIRVDRRDLVAQFTSLARALNLGVWHSHTNPGAARSSPGATDQPMTIDPAEFAIYCRDALDARRELDRLNATHRVFALDYERDIDTGDRSIYRRMFEFLSLPPIDPTWMRSTKVSPPVESYVTNARELYDLAARLQDEYAT